jgi:primosomal protein N' (replication factor Y)
VSTSPSIARVVLDSRLPQLDRLFDYSVPEGMAVAPGVRVKVPLRSSARHTTGYVVEVVSHSAHRGALAPITDVVSEVPVLSQELWSLARTVATRQAGNASDVLRLAIPARYARAEKKWREAAPEVSSAPPQVRELEEYSGESLDAACQPGARTIVTLPGGVAETKQGVTVTRGSLVVAQIVARALAAGGSSVVIVPDWRDLDVVHAALREVLAPEDLVLLRGGASGSERYTEYLRTLSGRPVVVLGNRHAVYAPVSHLAALVVVDDADDSHRELLAPYPHTRDVALIRQQLTGCSLILASLVPSMSATRWLAMGFFRALEPRHPRRADVIPTALSLNPDHDQSPARLPSIAHQGALAGLKEGPILVQVFRAGFSSALACASCAERGMCVRCHGPLRLTEQGKPPSCVWCAQVEARWRCAACNSTSLVPRGRGIGRTVAELGRAFPRATIIQSDGENIVSAVGSTPAVVVATRGAEPVAAGGYRAALLLDGRAMLSRENLGATEDALRFWEHAISLVHPSGRVFLAEVEGAPALAVASGRYSEFLRQELSQREALRLPPAIRIASVSGPASAVVAIRLRCEALSPEVDVLGPVAMGEGLVRVIVRFPYSLGDALVGELRAAHLHHIHAQGRSANDRVKIVVDDSGQLDALIAQ